jgi:antitoxin HigA-1
LGNRRKSTGSAGEPPAIGVEKILNKNSSRIPTPRVNDIVLEKRGITADTAIRLAIFFGTSEDFWMNLQASFEVRDARRLAKVMGRIQPRRRTKAA